MQSVMLTNVINGQGPHVRVAADSGGTDEARSPAVTDSHLGRFSQRNRIISGLCLGVVVVEAAPRTGSLSTANHAMEQNREVCAVLGPVNSLTSRGYHRLIRDGAGPVETVNDILEEKARWGARSARPTTSPPCATPPSWRSPIKTDPCWASSRADLPASMS
jgi:DNA processing protein